MTSNDPRIVIIMRGSLLFQGKRTADPLHLEQPRHQPAVPTDPYGPAWRITVAQGLAPPSPMPTTPTSTFRPSRSIPVTRAMPTAPPVSPIPPRVERRAR